MNINTQHVNTQQAASSVNPTTPQPVDNKEKQAQENELKTESTVNLSTEAQKLSTDTETSSKNNLESKEDAEDSALQFKKDAANDPVLTQQVQSNSLTSNEVSRLLGQ